MSDQSRRELLQSISAALAGPALLSAQEAQHVHQAVNAERSAQKGTYEPKALTPHEYATLQRLSDLIVPADEHSAGALAAGAADFIDFLCAASEEMKGIYTGGILWIDTAMQHRNDGKDFLSASAAQQTALLDLIAYRKNESPEWNPGIRFFGWVRRMVVDAYYTSPIGMKDLGYMGNSAMSQFSVPRESLDYALKRSPFA